MAEQTTPTILQRVKAALRISHEALDDQITVVIAGARAEMQRNGITATKAADDSDSLIVLAIISYSLYWFCNDEKQKAELFNAWQYQLDNLRKTSEYNTESEALNV